VIQARRWRTGLAAFGGIGVVLMIGVLSHAQDMTPRPEPGPLVAQPIPLDTRNSGRRRLGRLDFAGGLMLGAGSSSGFGGLSDMVVTPASTPDRLAVTTVTDEGQLASFEIRLDPAGNLAGADRLTMADLHEDGRTLGRAKARGDAEGLAFADGETLVAFEVDNRILAFVDPLDPAAPVRRLPLPQVVLELPSGEGLEALATADFGEEALLALGGEQGMIWLCPRRAADATGCRQITDRPPEALFRLTAITHIPGSRDFVALYRALDPLRGWRARIEHLAAGADGYRSENLARLGGPLSVDNFEGVSVSPLSDGGGWRIYVLSDDNFRAGQRTLLLAFDWRR